MANLRVNLVGLPNAIDAMVDAGDRIARRAQFSALREMRRRTNTGTIRALAKETGIVQKVLRKKVKAYGPFIDKRDRIVARVWAGMKRLIAVIEHPTVLQYFNRTSTKRPVFREAYGKRDYYVLDDHGLTVARVDIQDPVSRIMPAQAEAVMRSDYVITLRREYNRLVKARARKQRTFTL